MNELRKALETYIALRRNLGAKLYCLGVALSNFVAFAESQGASFITTDLALRWAKQPTQAQPAWWADRLQMVRRFAIWLRTTDPRTEVPPNDLLPFHYKRKQPYIYSEEEVKALVRTARRLPSSKGLRGHTYSSILALLSVTGMRVSEAVALDQEDVDLPNGILSIRRTKFGKSRLVPVHTSTRKALEQYARERDRRFPKAKSTAFFVSERGTRVTACTIRDNFVKVSREVGLRVEDGRRYGRGPRLHDMRHRFAVLTLLDWYRAGLDVEREIPKLATYLGHVHANQTYWYLEAVPELLQLATERLTNKETEDEE